MNGEDVFLKKEFEQIESFAPAPRFFDLAFQRRYSASVRPIMGDGQFRGALFALVQHEAGTKVGRRGFSLSQVSGV